MSLIIITKGEHEQESNLLLIIVTSEIILDWTPFKCPWLIITSSIHSYQLSSCMSLDNVSIAAIKGPITRLHILGNFFHCLFSTWPSDEWLTRSLVAFKFLILVHIYITIECGLSQMGLSSSSKGSCWPAVVALISLSIISGPARLHLVYSSTL